MKKTIQHKASFDLRNQNSFFGGWPVLSDSEDCFSIVIAFPLEDSDESAAVVVAQTQSGELTAKAYCNEKVSELAISQALAALSLNVDDSGWEKLGNKEPVIGALQKKYNFLRPILFNSPYEAAAGFVIGQRISIKQRQNLQAKMAEEFGKKIVVEGNDYFAFPTPQALLKITELKGLNATKIERLHGIAEVAMSGKLDRKYLLGLSETDALKELESLNGIGPFYASGILYRGAGIVDGVTDDDLTKYAIKLAYSLENEPNQKEVLEIAENWKPYRMWCEVLIHVWMRREIGMPKMDFKGKK